MSETSTEEELKMDFPMVPEFVGTGAADENIQERTEFEGWLSIGSIAVTSILCMVEMEENSRQINLKWGVKK